MSLKISGLSDFQDDIKLAQKELPHITRKAMDKSTQFIKNKVQNKIVSEQITFQGGLQQSVFARVQSPFKGIVSVGKKYGIFVEKGTRPHWPPIAPIEKWARIKLGRPGLGFVVARKIARSGTKAHPYFMPAVEKSVPTVRKLFDQTLVEFVDLLAGR